MKKHIKKFLSLIVCLGFIFSSLVACKDKVMILSLQVKEDSIVTLYEVGDDVTLEDLTIIIHYSDGSRDIVEYPSEGLIVSHLSTATQGTKKVLITYKDKSVYLEVNVVESIPVYLANKSIDELPNVDDITSQDESKIIEARELYDALDDIEKEKITNYDKLVLLEKKVQIVILNEYKEEKKAELAKSKSKEDYNDEDWVQIEERLNVCYESIDDSMVNSKFMVDYIYNWCASYLDGPLVYDEIVYVERIEVFNEGVQVIGDGEYYVIIDYGEENPYFIIQRKIYPENATSKVVEYAYDETNQIASVDKYGIVTFYKKGAITVYLKATDGSGVITILKIIAK